MKKFFMLMVMISLLLSATTVSFDKMKENSMKIIIQTASDTEVYIEYGLKSGVYTEKTKLYKSKEGKDLKISLDNLEMGQTYFFRIATKNKLQSNYIFENEQSFTTIENKKNDKKNNNKDTKEITIKPSGDIYKIPVLFSPTKNSIGINIFFSEKTEYYYQYGLDKNNLNMKTDIKIADKDDKSIDYLQNLKINSEYFYKLYYRKAGEKEFISSKVYSFNTAKTGNFSFIIEADPHFDENSSSSVYEKTLTTMLKENPDFLIDMGDASMVEKLTKMSDKELYERNSLVRSYWDNIAHSIPIFMVMGNHDGESSWISEKTRAKEFRNLLLPSVEVNSFYTGLSDTIYSFHWGNSLFIILNPFVASKNRPKDSWDWSLGKEQYNFLENTLKNDKSKFKFVFIHNLVGGNGENERGGVSVANLYEWGGYSENGSNDFNAKRPDFLKPIHELLKEYNVNVVFHGHDHFYAKEELDGIIYQLVPQPSLGNKQNIEDSAKEYGYKSEDIFPSSGFLKVDIKENNVQVSYISSEGEIITSYVVNRN